MLKNGTAMFDSTRSLAESKGSPWYAQMRLENCGMLQAVVLIRNFDCAERLSTSMNSSRNYFSTLKECIAGYEPVISQIHLYLLKFCCRPVEDFLFSGNERLRLKRISCSFVPCCRPAGILSRCHATFLLKAIIAHRSYGARGRAIVVYTV
jgi:hypothetical protein